MRNTEYTSPIHTHHKHTTYPTDKNAKPATQTSQRAKTIQNRGAPPTTADTYHTVPTQHSVIDPRIIIRYMRPYPGRYSRQDKHYFTLPSRSTLLPSSCSGGPSPSYWVDWCGLTQLLENWGGGGRRCWVCRFGWLIWGAEWFLDVSAGV